MANVPANLSREILHGGENAPCQEVALNAPEPELDLVEPRRVSRGEVEMHLRVRLEEGGDGPRLVRRQVVENHMNLAMARLTGHEVAEERDERRATRTACHAACHAETDGIRRSVTDWDGRPNTVFL